MADMGIGANVIGASVIGGETVYIDPDIPQFDHAYTIPVPDQSAAGTVAIAGASSTTITISSQTEEGDIDVVASEGSTISAPTNAATITVAVAADVTQAIDVPAQTATIQNAYYVVVAQTIDVPSQSVTAENPISGGSSLAAGYFFQARPVIGATAIGDEAGTPFGPRFVNQMAAVTQTATATDPVGATATATIAAPTLDANLRPIVVGSLSTTIDIFSASEVGDVDVGGTETATIALASQTATGTITVAGSAGNQQITGATNTATIGVEAHLAADHTTATATNTVLGGPVVEATHSTSIDVPTVANTFTVFWPVAANQNIPIPTQTFEGDVDVAVNTLQDGTPYVPSFGVIGATAIGDETGGLIANISGLRVSNATSIGIEVAGASDITIASPTNAVLGGPVVQAAHSASIAIPTQTATGTVFHNMQAVQAVAIPTQTASGVALVQAQSSTTITLTETATGDVDFTMTASQVINLASVRATATHHRPSTRSRARRYGGSSYPQPTEEGYLSWLSQWAS